MTETVVVRGEKITADLLLWRAYGVEGRALVVDLLAANPGLSAIGEIIPQGTEVIIPDRPVTTNTDHTPVVSLFGEV